MKVETLALGCVFVVTRACATVPPRAIALPPRDAPLEQRVAAYRAHAAMLHVGFGGWQMRLGRGEVRSLDDARPVLANAREAEDILHARDNRQVLGWSIFGVGTAVMLSSLFTLPSAFDSSRSDGFSLTAPMLLLGLGAAIALPSAFIIGGAERRVPRAAEAYNDWLWDELGLPQSAPDGRPPTPHPAPSPWAATP